MTTSSFFNSEARAEEFARRFGSSCEVTIQPILHNAMTVYQVTVARRPPKSA